MEIQTLAKEICPPTTLKKVMSMNMIAIYFGVVTMFIVLSGFIFNILL